jgi:hypothetical protein
MTQNIKKQNENILKLGVDGVLSMPHLLTLTFGKKKTFELKPKTDFSAPTTQLTAQVTPKVKDSFIWCVMLMKVLQFHSKALLNSLL